MIADPRFYLLAIPAVLLFGIGKGGFAGGLGMLATPLMALAIAPSQAAAILLPILCLMDLFSLYAFRGRWSRELMPTLLAGALAGIVLGTISFRALDEGAIGLLIGLMSIAFVLNQALGAQATAARAARPSCASGVLWSGLSGFTSFIAHAGGPPLMIYLLPQKLDKTVFVSTTVLLFAVVNYVKLIPYAWLGQITAINLTTSALLMPFAPLGVALGVWLHRRLDAGSFYVVSYVLLFGTGVKLVLDYVLARGWL